jgi:photosynthetic reaction center H subunit
MQAGAITGYFDVAQITLYGFWIFFAGVVFYCRREDKREGYPLVPEMPNGREVVEGFPPTPKPKVFNLGSDVPHPSREPERPIAAIATSPYPGSPLVPTGNPMIDGVGPAAWGMRSTEPEVTFEDRMPKIVPLRVARDFFVATEDPNPIGMPVVAGDNLVAGTVVDVWVDRAEAMIRYLEAEIPLTVGTRRAMIPMNLAKVTGGKRPRVRVRSILAFQFASVPVLASPDQITLREEDMVMGYFGGGTLYAKPSREEPLL